MMAPKADDPSTKTCLPQQSIFPLWKDGFETWHIAVFLVGLIFGNIALVVFGVIDRPTPGALSVEELLDPKNPVFKIYLATSVALFAKTHLMAWLQVWMGCKNNSFSKNVWDLKTGSPSVAARKTEDDLAKSTYHNIHGNGARGAPPPPLCPPR